MPQEQRIILFAGQVQGVGFRYAAVRAAQRHDVSGYVRNRPEGDVECVVEGEPGEIDAFVADLSERMRGYIRSRKEQRAPASGTFAGFDVRF